MAKANRVLSTPRRTASKIRTQKAIKAKAKDPDSFPDVYCLQLDGECLEPLLPDGSVVLVKKSGTLATGDFVAAWPRADGRPWLKRLALNAPPSMKFPHNDHPESEVKPIVMLEQLNPPRRYIVCWDKIHAMHKVIGFVPAGVPIGGTIKAKDVLPIGGR